MVYGTKGLVRNMMKRCRPGEEIEDLVD